MADTEAGRQVREDTPGGPYNPDHRATTRPRNPCGQGCSSYRRFAGPGAVTTSIRLRGCSKSDDRCLAHTRLTHHAHDCGVAFDVATPPQARAASGEGSRASLSPQEAVQDLGRGSRARSSVHICCRRRSSFSFVTSGPSMACQKPGVARFSAAGPSAPSHSSSTKSLDGARSACMLATKLRWRTSKLSSGLKGESQSAPFAKHQTAGGMCCSSTGSWNE